MHHSQHRSTGHRIPSGILDYCLNLHLISTPNVFAITTATIAVRSVTTMTTFCTESISIIALLGCYVQQQMSYNLYDHYMKMIVEIMEQHKVDTYNQELLHHPSNACMHKHQNHLEDHYGSSSCRHQRRHHPMAQRSNQ